MEGRTNGADVPLHTGAPEQTTIAVDAVAFITTECITVTSAMRKHARWAQSSVSAILGGSTASVRRLRTDLEKNANQVSLRRTQLQTAELLSNRVEESDGKSLAEKWTFKGPRGKDLKDNPLMSAFARLRGDLRGCTGESFLTWTS